MDRCHHVLEPVALAGFALFVGDRFREEAGSVEVDSRSEQFGRLIGSRQRAGETEVIDTDRKQYVLGASLFSEVIVDVPRRDDPEVLTDLRVSHIQVDQEDVVSFACNR